MCESGCGRNRLEHRGRAVGGTVAPNNESHDGDTIIYLLRIGRVPVHHWIGMSPAKNWEVPCAPLDRDVTGRELGGSQSQCIIGEGGSPAELLVACCYQRASNWTVRFINRHFMCSPVSRNTPVIIQIHPASVVRCSARCSFVRIRTEIAISLG